MRDEYDFTKGQRGKFFKPNTTMNLPVYLDHDVLVYFTDKAKSKGVELNKMINDLLKKDIALIEGVK
ncbi:hypothetical protein [Marinibactrum halimedae]|uniref:Toxin-antitoxin system, antitoxin component, ribbon-helix-helix domain protein n=1 Tax=Marinibactrum halimedae TaxID=1444977 RepID=A0AA37TF48_9GAMM|nr:hypothetical protein [Marinibactrum halimedae]MCD9461328.1 hypothetical protein [Marinibactrum halimedae]GLS27912.1 hypothetical protein GCM10007877_36310 [Marinibactrum halimedae]